MIAVERLRELAQQEMPFFDAVDRGDLLRHAREVAARHRQDFAGVRTYVMFIGYPRSGHSLFGALLDAHPEMVVAHELDALRFLQDGFGREEIFALLLENSRAFASIGRSWGPYSYEVAGQRQGRFEKLTVIGDKKAGITTDRLMREPKLLPKVFETFGPDVRFFHVVRDPLDNIATIARKLKEDVAPIIDIYLKHCETNAALIKEIGPSRVFQLHHEDFLADPRGNLAKACAFLGLPADPTYLEACARAVNPSPNKSRQGAWSPADLERLQARAPQIEFLRRYSLQP